MALKVEKVSELETWFVTPTPGYVLKFKTVEMADVLSDGGKDNRKCFVNVCHCTELPPPTDDLSEDELAAKIDVGDYGFRVPLSVGELDCVRDNKDQNAVKIDVLVNSVFFASRLSPPQAEFYRHFLCMVLCEAIEKKHNVHLDANQATRLQNRKQMGEIEPMRIAKRPPAPVIQELDQPETTKKIEAIPSDLPYHCPQPEGVSIRFLKGEKLEVRLSLDHFQPPVQDKTRLRLKLNDDRLLVLEGNSRSLFDFCVPFMMDPETARSKLSAEKNALFVSVNVVFPGTA